MTTDGEFSLMWDSTSSTKAQHTEEVQTERMSKSGHKKEGCEMQTSGVAMAMGLTDCASFGYTYKMNPLEILA